MCSWFHDQYYFVFHDDSGDSAGFQRSVYRFIAAIADGNDGIYCFHYWHRAGYIRILLYPATGYFRGVWGHDTDGHDVRICYASRKYAAGAAMAIRAYAV